MIVKTEDIKEHGNSIGMFSRNGKATALIHSIFRDKKLEKRQKRNIEDEYLARMMNLDKTKKEEVKEKRPSSQQRESFFFRAVSREKSQPLREKTPDSLIYKPKFEVIEPKTLFYGKLVPPTGEPLQTEGPQPPCLNGGINCDFKIRDLSKKIKKITEEINGTDIDIVYLHQERVIDVKTFDLFKDPDLTVIKRFSENRGYTDPGNVPNPTSLINQVVKFHNLKQQLAACITKNKEEIDHSEHMVFERPRPNSSFPVRFDKQIPRPAFGKDLSEQHDSFLDDPDPKVSKLFWRNELRKTHHFQSYTKRNLPYPYKHMILRFYDMTKYKNVKPKREIYMDYKKMSPRKCVFDDMSVINSVADHVNITEIFDQTLAPHKFSANLGKHTGRKNHFMKARRLDSPDRSRTEANKSMFTTFYTVNKINDCSFMSQVKVVQSN